MYSQNLLNRRNSLNARGSETVSLCIKLQVEKRSQPYLIVSSVNEIM